jgi:hypothetical protein
MNMKNKIQKIVLLVLLLLESVVAYGDSNASVKFQGNNFQETIRIDQTGNITLTFNLVTTSGNSDFVVELVVPNYINADNISSGNISIKDINKESYSDGFMKYIIALNSNRPGSSTTFNFNNLKYSPLDNENPCNWKFKDTLKVRMIEYNKVPLESSAYSEISATFIPPAQPYLYTPIQIYNSQNSIIGEFSTPYKLNVTVRHQHYNTSSFYTNRYTSELDSLTLAIPEGIKCVGVTKAINYNGLCNNSLISPIVRDSYIVILGEDLPVLGRLEYYSFYFTKDTETVSTYTLTPTLHYKDGVDCANNDNFRLESKTTSANISFSNVANSDNVKTPFLNALKPTYNCNNGGAGNFYVEADATFKGSKKDIVATDKLFYELKLDPDFIITRMELINTELSGNVNDYTISYTESNEDNEETIWIPMNFNSNSTVINFSSNNIKKIKVELSSGLNYSDFSPVFRYDYRINSPEANSTYYYEAILYRKRGDDISVLNQQKQNISVNCSTNPGTNTEKRYDLGACFFKDNATLSSPLYMDYRVYESVYNVMFNITGQNRSLNILGEDNITNFSFSLDDFLKFVINDDNKIYYSNSPNGNFEVLPAENYIYNEETDNKRIEFINLNNLGLSGNSIYLLYNVKLQNDAKPTQGLSKNIINYNSFTVKNPNGWSIYGINICTFSIQGTQAFRTYAYAGCDDKIAHQIRLTEQDRFTYHFEVDNYVNEIIRNVQMLISLPYENDEKITSSNYRNSSFAIPFDKVDYVEIAILDKYDKKVKNLFTGNLTDLLSQSDLEAKFTTKVNPCFNGELGITGTDNKANCIEELSWIDDKTIIPATPVYLMLNISKDDVLLNNFQKLRVTMQGDLPGSISIGNKASASFVAKADLLSPLENERPAVITIAQEKDCAPNIKSVILDPCRTYSIRYELPVIYDGDQARLEWSTPNDTTRRLIPACNLSYGEKCFEGLNPIKDPCDLSNNLSERIDICQAGQSVRLDAATSNAASYKWSNGAVSAAIDVQTPGVYSVTITPKNAGCSPVTQKVTVGGVNKACFEPLGAGAMLDACSGESVQLNVPDCGVSYSWSPVDYLSNPNIANPMASPPSSTSYNVAIITEGGCIINQTVYVNIRPPFELETGDAGNGILACRNEKVMLNASGADTYSWFPSDGLSCSDCANPEHTVSGNKTYTVTGRKGDCSVSKAIEIMQQPDEIFFDYEMSGDCKINFFATEGFSDYRWTFGDGKTGNGIEPTHDYRDNGNGWYTISVDATNACGIRISRSRSINITTEDCPCQAPKCQ